MGSLYLNRLTHEEREKLKKSLLDLADLKPELEELLKREVDVLTYKSLHPLLKDKILREQKAIL